MKKSILISILSLITLSNAFSQIFTHTNPPPATVCAGSTVTLQFYVTGTSSITPYGSYVVQFGQTIGTCAPITATVPCTSWYSSASPGTITATIPSSASGTYYLLVKHSNIAFANSSQPTVSVISAPSTPTVTASGSTAICPNSSITLTSTGTGPYLWNSGQNTSSITVSSPGTYFVTQTNACGSKTSNSVTVTSLTLPTISVSSPSVGCGSVVLSSTASNYSSINWSNGQSGVSASASSTGSYYATAVNSCGSTVSNTVSVTVNPTPSVSVVANNSSICIGQTSTLVVSGADTYSWNNGSTNDTIFVAPTTNTTYTVVSTGTNGCSKTSTVSVVVNQLPNVNIVSNVAMSCPGSPLNLTASGASTYSWNTGGNTNVIIVSPTVNTTYTVVGTSSAGCSKTSTIDISVYPDYTPTITTSDLMLCNGQTATITATSAFPWVISAYSWNDGSTNDTIFVTPTTNTTYTVVATDINFCNYTVSFTQNVSICTGVENVNNNSIITNVYPIPANDNINFELSNINENSDVTVNIYSIEGKIVSNYKLNFQNDKISLNVSNVESGAYLMEIVSGKQKTTKKIVISH